jgi:hypothetical protein
MSQESPRSLSSQIEVVEDAGTLLSAEEKFVLPSGSDDAATDMFTQDSQEVDANTQNVLAAAAAAAAAAAPSLLPVGDEACMRLFTETGFLEEPKAESVEYIRSNVQYLFPLYEDEDDEDEEDGRRVCTAGDHASVHQEGQTCQAQQKTQAS